MFLIKFLSNAPHRRLPPIASKEKTSSKSNTMKKHGVKFAKVLLYSTFSCKKITLKN